MSIQNRHFKVLPMVAPKGQAKEIPTLVKNQALVEQRRRQIVDAAVNLFIQNGFHKTTTRQIAQAAGISIGSLYEYIATKEDVLYLVCDAIHAEIEHGVAEALERAKKGNNPLAEVIREYFLVCHQMSDHILLIYQETQSLPDKWRRVVLENEIRITGIFTRVLANLMAVGALPRIASRQLDLVAHTISVLGHMWTFRRWFLANHYSIDEYIAFQTQNILGMCRENAQ
ncbi:Transcriptional regulator, TetR family [Desulfosarcina cetonica]|uniref:TetR/AcrR family transcriptional regulator n=1 Tax=Desulfosarcina cetonica TaxID=90730 RepID=UPI001BC0C639|nr:TetR/AcrR family transcriptional regulator [Desulfosarcina cetonica]VTR68476.1 Transcriptional regulator, TetR family [Desulfosarcina cetonica]